MINLDSQWTVYNSYSHRHPKGHCKFIWMTPKWNGFKFQKNRFRFYGKQLDLPYPRRTNSWESSRTQQVLLNVFGACGSGESIIWPQLTGANNGILWERFNIFIIQKLSELWKIQQGKHWMVLSDTGTPRRLRPSAIILHGLPGQDNIEQLTARNNQINCSLGTMRAP